MILTSLTKYRDLGLLLLRVALGVLFIYVHGWPNLAGGRLRWQEIGHDMHYVHINFAPALWGFIAAFSESIGGALFAIGFFFRPSCILLALTMTVVSIMEWKTGGLVKASHALELLHRLFLPHFHRPRKIQRG